MPGNTARRGGGGPRTRRGPPEKVQSVDEEDGEEEENSGEQTEGEKRRVRRQIREMTERMNEIRKSGVKDDEFHQVIQEAQDVLKDVRGTTEAIEDAKLFKMLCQQVREMSEDTNTNEKKFHVDEFAVNIGRHVNSSIDKGNNVKMTRNQLISLGQKVSSKFRRTPSFSFILGAIDTEAPGEDGEKVERRQARRMERAKAAPATKTAIVERSQADGQMTDKLVTSTRNILNQVYRSNGKKPVDYFKFVIDPESFGNTVENMFHVSFLVKQRVVQLSVDKETELPVLEPVSSSRHGGDSGDGEAVKNQAIISLSYDDWEELVAALDIKKAAIVHDEELRRAISSKQ